MNWLKRWGRDPVFWGGALVVLVTQVVYLMTLNVSCPFWDSGEFIATSYVLGIPHPPGTPLYVLIGRLFTLIPIASVAARVNYLSALASTLAALFTYLVVIGLARRWLRRPENGTDRLIAIGGGLVAAFFTAFGRTFWDNAIEAEVYALSSFVMILAVWLALRWEASGSAGQRNNNLLLLIGFLLFVAVGIHMGSLLVAPAILLYVLLVSWRAIFPWSASASRTVTLIVAGAVFLIWLVTESSLMNAVVLWALAMLVVVAFGWWSRLGHRNLPFWFALLAIAGLSVQLFMMVRAGLDPPINEADPSNWERLWLVLSRDQYRPPDPFSERQAPWAVQFTKHFWRYIHDQYHLGLRPAWFSMMIPFLIGGVGAAAQFWRDRRRFLLVATLVFFTTFFLIFYLNFKEDEVRDRDYFFVAGYHFFTIWIGLGAVAIARWLRGDPREVEGQLLEPSGGRVFGIGTAAILVLLSLFPVRHGWHEHDRSDFYVARDYAWNMLTPLEQDSIVFTNGDNDTFPLWYLQEVEGIRRDVRVVNLSLLNTHWYIRQLRDIEPRVRISLSEEEIDQLRAFMMPDGEIILVKDVMVHHILNENWDDRPIYVAVTVPETMDLENHMMMEGLVYRIVEEEYEGEQVDIEKTMHNLTEVFVYRGLLDEQGEYDESVYKDRTASKLAQNYAAAYVHVAQRHLEEGRDDAALDALERARQINPYFTGVLYTQGYLWLQKEQFAKAEETFRRLLELGERTADAYRLLAATLEAQGRIQEAEGVYRSAVEENPDVFELTQLYFTHLWTSNRRSEAVAVVQDWLRRHPEDSATRRALQDLLRPQAPGAEADSQLAPAGSEAPEGTEAPEGRE
ncbi:MAG: DUF2723 domain-containing protein [Candidatus Eisenbacteria bacterium]|nr:DUF2723 domain-containing protein [Candidatus Eisenbacteria bacterium]